MTETVVQLSPGLQEQGSQVVALRNHYILHRGSGELNYSKSIKVSRKKGNYVKVDKFAPEASYMDFNNYM